MNSYEYLQEEAREDGVNVIDYPFDNNRIRGLYCDGTVAIRQDMTTVEKSCVLAEELGHHRMTVGNILDQNDVANRKQEHLARLWAYDRRIGLREPEKRILACPWQSRPLRMERWAGSS